MRSHTVAVAIAEDRAIHPYDLYEYGIVTSVFGCPPPGGPDSWYDLRLCAVEPGCTGPWPGFRLESAYSLDDLASADTVIVPSVPMAVIAGEREPHPGLLDALRRAAANGARVVSLCAGAYALAAAGLLDGRRITVNASHAQDLIRRYPNVTVDDSVLYLDDGDILTSAGMSAGLDLCLHLVRRDLGARAANRMARLMTVPAHRPGGQSQFVELSVPDTDDDSLAPVLEWAASNLDRPLAVTELARRASMSERTFHRRLYAATGTTPGRWLRHQRLIRAQTMLESTDLSVERISRDCGLGTAANLRRHFGRSFGVAPSDYRRAFLVER